MSNTPRLPRLLLASGLAAASLIPARAGAAPDGGGDAPGAQGVTFRVGTRTERDRKARRAADGADRVRAGAPAASGLDADEQQRRPGKVFGTDDRFAISDPAAYPWSAVCRILAVFPDGSEAQGTAVMIGDRFALTAGHVVYDSAAGGFAETVEVVPAYDGGDAPFGTFLAEDVTSFRGWTEDGNYDWDFALLSLDGAAGDATGWLGLAAKSDADLAGATVNTAGYAGDLADAEFMYGATGTVSRVLPGQIEAKGTLDAAGGQSGSGLWLKTGDLRYVLGVISTETSTANRAARITGDVYDALTQWMDEADAADLAVTDLRAALPREFGLPYSTSAAVVLANDGATAATTALEISARDLLGNRTVLATRTVTLAAGGTRNESLPISLPTGFAAGTYVLEAAVNRDGAVLESDYDDDRLDGPQFVVLPPYETLTLGSGTARTFGPGGVARYRVDVPAGMASFKVRVSGPHGTVAAVTAPDGSVTYVRPSSLGIRFRRPMAGTWLVDLRTSVTQRRVRSVALNVGGR